MIAAKLLQALSQAGGHVTADNGDLVLKAARPLPDDLLAELKCHKPEILAALAYKVDAEAEHLREHFEERAGILEYDAGLPRAEAELEAAKITATYARNCGYQWASLRSALSAYPELLASLPNKARPGGQPRSAEVIMSRRDEIRRCYRETEEEVAMYKNAISNTLSMALVAVLLAACASIVGSTSDPITINSHS